MGEIEVSEAIVDELARLTREMDPNFEGSQREEAMIRHIEETLSAEAPRQDFIKSMLNEFKNVWVPEADGHPTEEGLNDVFGSFCQETDLLMLEILQYSEA